MANNDAGSAPYTGHITPAHPYQGTDTRENEPMTHDDVRDVLNELLETCRDGEYGFQLCAEEVEDGSISSVLSARAAECRRAAEELQPLILAFGGEPDEGGSNLGAAHRGWVHVKGAVGANSDKAILTECERGEDAAVERYREALEKNLPATVRPVVERQAQGVQKNHDQIKALRDQERARAEKS